MTSRLSHQESKALVIALAAPTDVTAAGRTYSSNDTIAGAAAASTSRRRGI